MKHSVVQHSSSTPMNWGKGVRDCWEMRTSCRSSLLSRSCLVDLKDKEHLVLPCFLADHDQYQSTGSGLLPNSTEESQLSQQIDIATPLPTPTIYLARSIITPTATPPSAVRPSFTEKPQPSSLVIKHDDPSDSPVLIDKRMPSTTTGLTEKQKEKFRTRHPIPLLCDDSSSAQSQSNTMDTPTIESMMATYQLRRDPPSTADAQSLFQPTASSLPTEASSPCASPPATVESTDAASASSQDQDEDIPEESSIARKLRRSRRPSTSARKSLTNNARKNRLLLSSDDLSATSTVVPSIVLDPPASQDESPKKCPLKSILKRLSPSKPRRDHCRRVAFHDQVKVLLFASPARKDPNLLQAKKKSPVRDDRRTSTIVTRRSATMNSNPRMSKLFTLAESVPDQPSTEVMLVNNWESTILLSSEVCSVLQIHSIPD